MVFAPPSELNPSPSAPKPWPLVPLSSSCAPPNPPASVEFSPKAPFSSFPQTEPVWPPLSSSPLVYTAPQIHSASV
ncbi:hypothetical protein DNTS_004745 [Danionella cerebrum]|uniref:Uncharacterized protein n=1 Tax=Danionella cerebrum TaxID=2873325 RepID=A0A553R5Z7_9TELE|nr:hypothetical protein DNTS_004745 [Danionella translucida]